MGSSTFFRPKRPLQISSTINFSTSLSGPAQAAVTGASVSITTLGGPVNIYLISDGSTSASYIGFEDIGSVFAGNPGFELERDSTVVQSICRDNPPYSAVHNKDQCYFPPRYCFFRDKPAAGTYTYSINITHGSSGTLDGVVVNCKLVAHELWLPQTI